MKDTKILTGSIISSLFYHWSYDEGALIGMEEINEYNQQYKKDEGDYLFDEEQLKYIEENLAGWEISTECDGYHNHDGQVCEYTAYLEKDGAQYAYSEEFSLVTGWFLRGDVTFHLVEQPEPRSITIEHDDGPEEVLEAVESILTNLGVPYEQEDGGGFIEIKY